MNMRQHMKRHHAVDMHPDAEERTINDLHHYDHTFNRPGHKLDEHLLASTTRPDFLKPEPIDAAAAQRAKSDQWKPRGRP